MNLRLPQRRLIPRWRPVAATLATAEALSTTSRSAEVFSGSPDELDKAISLWRKTKMSGVLGEVLSFSVHPNLLQKVIEVGHEAIKSGAPVTSVQSMLIYGFRDAENSNTQLDASAVPSEECNPFQVPIRRLRALLRFAPDNVLALLDFAQLQVAIGKTKSAQRALCTALNLAPNNRVVLRTVARFFMHCRDEKLAHRLIQQHARTPSDPWLMASEIALANAAGVNSSFLSKGKRFLLEQPRLGSANLTELAGAIAIEEMMSGNMKRAREAQRKALLAPNDNVIAQAIDNEQTFGIQLDSPPVTRALKASHEALAIQALSNYRPDDMSLHSQLWHAEEPFSSRPIQLLSATYNYKGEFEKAELWNSVGLNADPDDFGLLICMAYTKAQLGKVAEAESHMRRLRHLYFKRANPYCIATEGLLAYQQEKFDDGDGLYDAAVTLFNQDKQEKIGAFCRLNQILAALDYGHPRTDEIVKNAKLALETYPSPDSAMLLQIRSSIYVADVPGESKEKRRLSQWVYDPATNSLFEKARVTSVGAQPLIILDRKS
jgi:tetratricopeptide (TPR) repeat protein